MACTKASCSEGGMNGLIRKFGHVLGKSTEATLCGQTILSSTHVMHASEGMMISLWPLLCMRTKEEASPWLPGLEL